MFDALRVRNSENFEKMQKTINLTGNQNFIIEDQVMSLDHAKK